MWVEAALLAWTIIAFSWWFISLSVVSHEPSPPKAVDNSEGGTLFLTIFKPLPRLPDLANIEKTAASLYSFVQQMDSHCEMLLGIHPDEMYKWRPYIEKWKRTHPYHKLNIVIPGDDSETDHFANRKVSWQQVLARHARGDLWLWSDADISAPPHYLREVRQEYQSSAAGLITNCYVVREVKSAPDLLNALFVNVEIFPGVRFIGRKSEIRFGLGAGLLFSRKDFEAKIDWAEAGSYLADDFFLGNRLKPARLGSTILETYSGSATLRQSIIHYLRWQKTIRWCNPTGFASQITVLPVLGWLAYTVWQPFSYAAWTGLISIILTEAAWAALLFRFTGCRPPLRFYGWIPAWSVFRVFAFLACWLPWPVIWRSQAWWGPIRRS